MSEKKKRVVVCLNCGQPFETTAARAVYCSPECRKAAMKSTKPKRRKTEQAEPKKSLDEKLKELEANGTTYSQAQQAETIERFARVEVPDVHMAPLESFARVDIPEAYIQKAEVPEILPVEIERATMNIETRIALIKAQAKLEVLLELFKTEDGIDMPGKVIGEVIVLLSEILNDGREL